MNKLMGFFALRELAIPTVRWQAYTGHETLDPAHLWTVRTAVLQGEDTSLPRKVGVPAAEAQAFADAMLAKLGPNGLLVYYPYFVAQVSGTLAVSDDALLIECVAGDLWRLVSEGHCDLTLRMGATDTSHRGDLAALSPDRIEALQAAARGIRPKFRDALAQGQAVLLEWSFAQDCDLDQRAIGEPYLVFYECRVVAGLPSLSI